MDALAWIAILFFAVWNGILHRRSIRARDAINELDQELTVLGENFDEHVGKTGKV